MTTTTDTRRFAVKAAALLAAGTFVSACDTGGSGELGEPAPASTDVAGSVPEEDVLDVQDCLNCPVGDTVIFQWVTGEPGPRQNNFVSVTRGGEVTLLSGLGGGSGSGGHTSGAFFTIEGQSEAMASGKTIAIRAQVEGAAGTVLPVAYSTADVGNSGWQEFTLSGEREWITFNYSVPEMNAGNGDYLGFMPGDGVEIRLFQVVIEPNSGS